MANLHRLRRSLAVGVLGSLGLVAVQISPVAVEAQDMSSSGPPVQGGGVDAGQVGGGQPDPDAAGAGQAEIHVSRELTPEEAKQSLAVRKQRLRERYNGWQRQAAEAVMPPPNEGEPPPETGAPPAPDAANGEITLERQQLERQRQAVWR
jgi:hypothetical protein